MKLNQTTTVRPGGILKMLLVLGIFAVCGKSPLAAAPVGDTLKLTLEEALQVAMNDNKSMKIADQEIIRVDYLKKENWYNLLPEVSASGQYTNNVLKPVFFADFAPGGKISVGSTNAYTAGAQLQVPLLAMGIYKSIQLSEIEMRLALESARATKIDLITQVKNAFFGILMAEESFQVLEKSFQNATETAQNIKRMYEQGLASEYDQIRSEVAARNILPTLTATKSTLELAKMQLKVLLSIDMDIPIEIAGAFMQYESEIFDYQSIVDYSLAQNSQLKQLDINKEKLEKTFQLIRTQRMPSIGGFANYSLQMQNDEFTFHQPWSNSFGLGLMINIPIFSKLSNSMKERQTRVGIRQLDLQKELLSSNLKLSAQNSMNEMLRAKVQLASDKEAVSQAQKGYEIAKVRYTTGIGTVLELNDSEVALTRSQLSLNQALYDYLRARNEYEKVLGTAEDSVK